MLPGQHQLDDEPLLEPLVTLPDPQVALAPLQVAGGRIAATVAPCTAIAFDPIHELALAKQLICAKAAPQPSW